MVIKRYVVFFTPQMHKDPLISPLIYVEQTTNNVIRIARLACQQARTRDEYKAQALAGHFLYFLGKESVGQEAKTYVEARAISPAYANRVKHLCFRDRGDMYYQKCLSIVKPYLRDIPLIAVNSETYDVKEIN